MHACMHAYMHTCIHTYIYMYFGTCNMRRFLRPGDASTSRGAKCAQSPYQQIIAITTNSY